MSSGDSNGLQQVSKIVNSFFNKPETLAFREPVNPKAMGIPDYPQIVKNPMDLGTVRTKLEEGRYERAEDVARDVRLIWSNCILYNSPGSEFGLLAAGLAKKFEERFSRVKTAEKERDRKPSARSEPVNTKAPTLDEKVRFTYDLYRTTKVDVGQVMEQVDARCPQALKSPADDEVELNVDMLDPLTFRFVERLLRQSLQGNASAISNNSAGTTAASASSTSSSTSKSKSGGGGGGGGSSGGSSGPKKRKNSDGETRPKKQRA
ncbi:unnamed protein product [Ectocarpus sp. 6 AP-2014]